MELSRRKRQPALKSWVLATRSHSALLRAVHYLFLIPERVLDKLASVPSSIIVQRSTGILLDASLAIMTSTLKKSRSDETMASQFAAITTLKEDLYDEGSVDPVYQAKTRVLNQALQEIGMGKYQVSTISVV